jgi:hypothetical protein
MMLVGSHAIFLSDLHHIHACPDIVAWDSHPLALGATPKQVWIDGISQIESPFSSQKPAAFQKPPATPDFDREAYEAIKYDGLPPLQCDSPNLML